MIGDKDLAVPGRIMDLAALRSKLAAHNVANADVKGFRRMEADFDAAFAEAVASGDLRGVRAARIRVTQGAADSVDSEAEVAQMTKNSGMFNTFSEIASFRLRMLRTAINSK